MRHFHRSPFLPFLLGALTFALFLTGCHHAPPPEESAALAPVKAAEAESVELAEWTDLIAATQPLPDQAARITTAVPGLVVRVLSDGNGKSLHEGQRIDKDQIILQLDDRTARAQRDKTQAMMIEVRELKFQADLAYKLAQLDLDRLQKLNPMGTDGALPLVSKIELDKTRLLLQESESKQRAAVAKEQALQEEFKALDVQLEYHALRAPIAGFLGTMQVMPGQTLTAGTTVAEVINLDALDAVAFASPHVTAKLKLGQAAKVLGQSESADGGAGGTITYIAHQAQPETGNFLVKVRFANKDQAYRASQVVRLELETQKKKARLVIHESALIEDHDPPYVVIAKDVETKKNKDGQDEKIGKARRVYAHLGVRDREHDTIEIVGLEDPEKKEPIAVAGTLFILEGGHGLHDGDLIKIEEAKHEEAKHP